MISRPFPQWLNTRDRATLKDALRAIIARHGKLAAWLVPAIYACCAAAFIADLVSSNTLAFGVFYAPLIATGVFHRDKRSVWVLTAIACILNIIGALFPNVAKDVAELVQNRILSSLALLATAAFTWHARMIQERLARQTARAEAAERIKSEILTNLSEEIRAPLQSMIGILDLIGADSRAHQKAALGMVRGAGRRLLMTVDNLVDLTRLDTVPIPNESVDLGALVRQTAEAKIPDAVARQISLTVDATTNGDALVRANQWATRRILENEIADAIMYTQPGGHIEVRIDTEEKDCTVVIATSGSRPPGAFLSASDTADALLTPSAMGLALSQRLARTMGARLVFSDAPVKGSIIRLLLTRVSRPDAGASVASPP